MNLNEQKICFIGAGNMAHAIVGGLVKKGLN
ncbi:NAD(P)-binding domain-containing protein, partial [Oleiphilus sp. HI0128]